MAPRKTAGHTHRRKDDDLNAIKEIVSAVTKFFSNGHATGRKVFAFALTAATIGFSVFNLQARTNELENEIVPRLEARVATNSAQIALNSQLLADVSKKTVRIRRDFSDIANSKDDIAKAIERGIVRGVRRALKVVEKGR